MRHTAAKENPACIYKLDIKKSARKELDNLPNQIFLKIDKAILSLKKDPSPYPQSKELKGENKRRLRVGDYRVVYAVDEQHKIITIFRVRHRKDAYRQV
ncbi:MAG: type II toxin-antitoxin system RelE/ParE family toxin [Thermodesulfovibrionales bacterium]|jgi:mRNA interferase RelE/StbE|nr:type II toxin-antitoxin system RelE/ParE family toxin [Thermodesulfovibrionales bacterium]